MLEKMTRLLMRHGNRAAAQKTLLKTLFKLRVLAERDFPGISPRELRVGQILNSNASLKIAQLRSTSSTTDRPTTPPSTSPPTEQQETAPS